jgi:hypothetical protein
VYDNNTLGSLKNIKLSNNTGISCIVTDLELHEKINTPTCAFVYVLMNSSTTKIKAGDEFNLEYNSKKYSLFLYKKEHINGSIFLHLYHKSQLLKNMLQYNIFLKKKPSDAVEEICKTLQIKCDFQGLAMANNMLYEFFMQYNETAMNFLNRCCYLMCCYWFCNENGSITIMYFENTKATKDINVKGLINVASSEWSNNFKYRNIAYNSDNPALDLTEKDNTLNDKNFYYKEWYSDYYMDKAAGGKLAKYEKASYVCKDCKISTYDIYTLAQKTSLYSEKYLVNSITYRENFISSNESAEDVSINEIYLSNALPIPIFSWPEASIQKATVVAKEGSIENILYKDKFSRVLVNFHFDDKKQDVPIFVMQKNANVAAGSQFLPRHNEEVLVDFINKNPNMPIVLGSLYNSVNVNNMIMEEEGFAFNHLKPIAPDLKNSFIFNNVGETAAIKMHSGNQILVSIEHKNMEINLEGKTAGNYLTTLKNGNYVTTLTKGNYENILTHGNYLIQLDEGNLSIQDKKGNFNINLESGDLEISLTKGLYSTTIKDGDMNFKLDKGSINIEASDDITFKSKNIIFDIEDKYEVKTKDMKYNISNEFKIENTTLSISSKSAFKLEAVKCKISGSAKTDISGAVMKISSPACTIDAGAFQLTPASLSINNPSLSIGSPSTMITSLSCMMTGMTIIANGVLKGKWIPSVA